MMKIVLWRHLLCLMLLQCAAIIFLSPTICNASSEPTMDQAAAMNTTASKQNITIKAPIHSSPTRRTRTLKKSTKKSDNININTPKEWGFPKSKVTKNKTSKDGKSAKSPKAKHGKSSKKKKDIWNTPTRTPASPSYLKPTSTSTPTITTTAFWSQLGNTIRGEAPDDEAGRSISLSSDGTIVAIGAPYNENSGSGYYKRGHVRIYKWDAIQSSWIQLGNDIDGEGAGDLFGESVALSADGMMVAVGAPEHDDDRGHVRIYKWDADQSLWSQLGNNINGENAGDLSGQSVALSSDGMIIAIGAPDNDGNKGHVRIYKWDTDQAAWSQLGDDIDGEAFNDLSGLPVSLSFNGRIVAIGATSNDGNEFNSDRGHVRVYEWDEDLSTWSQLGQDIDGEAADNYSGWSVAMSSDGTIVAIGAPYNGNGYYRGHVRVYKWEDDISTWSQLGDDIDGEASCDFAGKSVSLSSDGTTVAIGAPFNDSNGFRSGQVRVYKWDEGLSTWSRHGNGGTISNGEASFHQFGYSVALSSDGMALAIGAPFNSGFGNDSSGYVKVYSLNE
jgi:hypothetical protein